MGCGSNLRPLKEKIQVMDETLEIDSEILRQWLVTGKNVTVLDVRPIQERIEWSIPASIHVNAYDKLKALNQNALQGVHLAKDVPVVTVCAGGNTSLIAANLLQGQGYEAYSLHGGMKGWSLSWNTAKVIFPSFEIIQFRRTGKGCLSYMITSDKEAMVIDASLPVQNYTDILSKEGLELRYVAETHVHADHLSRSKLLAEENNVPLYMPVPNQLAFEHSPVRADTQFKLGGINIKVLQTPGHTMESVSYLINELVLLTGDTLFTNGVGRPDLKSSEEEAIKKSKLLYQSLQEIMMLDEDTIILPAHSSRPVDFDGIPIQAILRDIKDKVPMLKLNEEEFIQMILQRTPPPPANYIDIVQKNISGDIGNINPIELEVGANRCAIS